MSRYRMLMADGTYVEEAFCNDRCAVMHARRHNEASPPESRIVDVLSEMGSILYGPQRSMTDRILAFVESKGYKVKRGRTHYVIESGSRKLFRIVPRLQSLVRKDLGGFVITGEECLDFRGNKWLFRIVFD